MRLPKVTGFLVESSILDLAAAVLLVKWIRRRGEIQTLSIFGAGTPTPFMDDALARAAGVNALAWGKYRRTMIVVDFIRKMVCTQAFFFFVAALFNKNSWLNREIRSFGRMLLRRGPAQASTTIVKADTKFPRFWKS